MVTDNSFPLQGSDCKFSHLLNSSVWKSLWIMLTPLKLKVPAEIRSDASAASRLSQYLVAWDLLFNLWCFMHLDRGMFCGFLILAHIKRGGGKWNSHSMFSKGFTALFCKTCIRLIILFELRLLFWRGDHRDKQQRPGEVSPRLEFCRFQLKKPPQDKKKKKYSRTSPWEV